MFSQILLLLAAGLLIAMGFIHSYLGEKYLFSRLFVIPDLPLFRRDRQFTERVLRFAWHITSLGWLGFASLLCLMSFGKTHLFGIVISITLVLHGIFILVTCGMKHPAWALFLLSGVCVWLAI
jgi:hypothetical protein